jgi:glycerophosphoryl diester phosphodiesterase
LSLPAPFHRSDRPIILGHRGSSAERPENTEAAFRLALSDGADGVELDVMRCRSGEVVVVHDADLGRLAGHPGLLVASAPWSELKGLDVGSWFGSAYASARLLTLPQALEALGSAALCNVELKGRGLGDPKLAPAVARVLAASPNPERFVVSSFNPFHLYRFHAAAPRIASGLLFSPGQNVLLRSAASAPLLRVSALHPEHRLCTVANLRRWQGSGYDVVTWTIDQPAVAVALHGAGVAAVVSNRPRELLAAFRDLRAPGRS